MTRVSAKKGVQRGWIRARHLVRYFLDIDAVFWPFPWHSVRSRIPGVFSLSFITRHRPGDVGMEGTEGMLKWDVG